MTTDNAAPELTPELTPALVRAHALQVARRCLRIGWFVNALNPLLVTTPRPVEAIAALLDAIVAEGWQIRQSLWPEAEGSANRAAALRGLLRVKDEGFTTLRKGLAADTAHVDLRLDGFGKTLPGPLKVYDAAQHDRARAAGTVPPHFFIIRENRYVYMQMDINVQALCAEIDDLILRVQGLDKGAKKAVEEMHDSFSYAARKPKR